MHGNLLWRVFSDNQLPVSWVLHVFERKLGHLLDNRTGKPAGDGLENGEGNALSDAAE